MDMTRKAMRAKEAIASIAQHDDEPAEVRIAVLGKLGEFVAAQVSGIQERTKARAEAAAKAAEGA